MTAATSRAKTARKAGSLKLYDSIERAVTEKVRRAGAPHPARLGKAARIAVDAVDDMDPASIAFLTARPARLKKAWKDALKKMMSEAPAGGAKRARHSLGAGETANPMSPKDSESMLAALTGEAPEDDPIYATYSSTEAAAALGVTRPTILQWIEENRLIGVKGAKRGWRIPKAQIRRRRPAPGLSEIVASIGDAETAWDFLTRTHTVGRETINPLDALFAGQTGQVLALAEDYGRSFS